MNVPSHPEIPALPVAYVQALRLLSEPDADVDRLAETAAGDPAFTASLLRLANSAASSPVRRLSTAREAIVRVGLPASRRTIIGVTLRHAFRGANGSLVDEDEMWRHLIATAVLAEEIARGEAGQGEAFTAGLLHDVGRLAMAAEDPRRYAQVVRLARAGHDTEEAERKVFGIGHAHWGANLGRRWGFPDAMVDAILDHHDGHSSGLAWVVARAREFSNQLGIGDGVVERELAPDCDAAGIPVLGNAGGPDAILQRIDRFQRLVRSAA